VRDACKNIYDRSFMFFLFLFIDAAIQKRRTQRHAICIGDGFYFVASGFAWISFPAVDKCNMELLVTIIAILAWLGFGCAIACIVVYALVQFLPGD